jgi:4-coumarate--CoA ligase
MATIVEKTPKGTIYRAAKTYPIPDVDILTLLFGQSYTNVSLYIIALESYGFS